MPVPQCFSFKETGKTQADSAFAISLAGYEAAESFQVKLEVSETPTAGTLAVEVLVPGGSDYYAIGSIDMTDPSEYSQIIKDLAITSVRFTPSLFDADKSYDVIVTARRKE